MSYASTLRAKLDNTNDVFPKRRSLDPSTLEIIAEREYQKKIMQGFKKRDPSCKICFCKIAKNGSCNC